MKRPEENLGRFGASKKAGPGMHAKKSLGQNFLISPGIVERIAEAGEIRTGETVIEVGPGKGVLTQALLDKRAKVKAIEKDDRLVPVLRETFRKEIGEGNLELVHGDIMDPETFHASCSALHDFKVIANIPYYITGALIRNFLSTPNKPSLMILMVQKEVANRIIARDGKESILSLSVKAYATPSLVMNVSRGNFFPIPNVDSAVIKLSNIKNPFSDEAAEERFFEVVKAGFSSKRKKLISNLEAVGVREEWRKKFEALGIGENARAEDVKLEVWLSLSK